ncbi:MAG TPA: efflux RND transporter permease subunit [Rhodanobacteraceae bacterium]|nr:efflux RND transporter permease subunit [Rhodanobacteraceae bacterium]
MNLFTPLLRRPAGLILLAAGLCLVGAISYLRLGVAPLPELEFPGMVVVANQPGASAQTMATTVAAPLERHLGSIAGVSSMQSTSSEGSTAIFILFDFGRNVDDAARDVQAAINASMKDLPSNLPGMPTYFKFNTNTIPLLLLTLTSKTETPAQLYQQANLILSPRLAQVEGVSRVQVFGASTPAVQVELNLHALAALHLSANDVRNALVAANVTSPQGMLSNGQRNLIVTANDQLHTADDFASLVIAVRNGKPIHLRDVADVYSGPENPYAGAWYNGERAVVLQVQKHPNANAVAAVARIRAKLPALAASLPPAVHIHPIFDLTGTTKASVREVELSLLVSIVMVVLVMLLFLRRGGPTVIAALSVPLSLAGAFVVMWGFGYTLNNLSLMALVICIGFVVDDAIVVIENIVRHIEAGMRPFEAAVTGLGEIAFTVVSITVSLLAVFTPMLFESSMVGMILREFSVTLAAAVVISAIVSLTLTPTLCAHYLRADRIPQSGSEPTRWQNALARFDARLLHIYERMLDWAMRHRRLMRWQPALLLGLTLVLAVAVAKTAGTVGMPAEDTGLVRANVTAGTNIAPGLMRDKLQHVAALLAADPAVLDVTAILGGQFGGAIGNSGSIFIDLKPQRDLHGMAVIERLRKRVAGVPGADTSVRMMQFIGGGGGNGGSGGTQNSFQLRADSGGDLGTASERLVHALRKLPQLRDVTSDYDAHGLEQRVVVDRQAASRAGISMAAVDTALYSAFGRQTVSTIYSDVTQSNVVLSTAPQQTVNAASLTRVYVLNRRGAMVPLSQIAHIQLASIPPSVSRYNQARVVNIGYNIAPGVSPSKAEELIQQTTANLRLPGGIRADFSSPGLNFGNMRSNFLELVIAAIIVMYVVLGMLYESLRHPLTILSTLPAAGAGAFLALLVTHTPISAVAIIALLLLIGIIKKNAILLVDFALVREREGGQDPVAAIREAALVRFRPILMTTLVAMGAALPLAIGFGVGSEMRQPLGIAMIGGLFVSQLLTLLSTPAIYLSRHDRLERKAARRARRAERKRMRLQAKGQNA